MDAILVNRINRTQITSDQSLNQRTTRPERPKPSRGETDDQRKGKDGISRIDRQR